MGAVVPSIEELRRRAEEQGVTPTDDDLERVRSFLAVLGPQLEALVSIVHGDAPPAAVYRPELERP